MKGSSIALRLADFLRRHPPFQFMTEQDLLELCRQARVKFCEEGELVFSEGETRRPFVYVVQKGTVRVFKQSPGGEELVDLRGEGDLLGLNFFLGGGAYVHSTRTESETLLCALPGEPLQRLLGKYPEAVRYLAAYFSLNQKYSLPGRNLFGAEEARSAWLDERQTLPNWTGRGVAFCFLDEPLRQAAKTLSHYRTDTLVVVDENLHPHGLITVGLLRDLLAEGAYQAGAPARSVMRNSVLCAPDQLVLGEYLLRLLRHRQSFLCLTVDGSRYSPVVRCLSGEDLLVAYGTDPTALVREIERIGPDPAQRPNLARLRERGEAYARAGLARRESIEWLVETASALRIALLRRIYELAWTEITEQGLTIEAETAFFVLDRAGRREFLGHAGLDWTLLHGGEPGDPPGLPPPGLAALGRALANLLGEAGFVETGNQPPRAERRVLSVGEFALAAFSTASDLGSDPAHGGWCDTLWVAGSEFVRDRTESALRLPGSGRSAWLSELARSALQRFPPLTIFRDRVVDEEGGRSDVLHLQQAVLRPLVEAARVLAFQAGIEGAGSTFERLRQAARGYPEQSQLLEEAGEALRIVLHLQAGLILTGRGDGDAISPALLPRLEQHQLRSAFRPILALLEFTAAQFHLTREE